MKIIPNWKEKKLRCHFCGETRSVKYETEVFDPVISDKTTMVCICNKCALRYKDHPTEKAGGGFMTIGRLSFGIRKCGTNKFRWFYCPLGKGISRERFVFFWWIGRKWYIALPKKKGGEG